MSSTPSPDEGAKAADSPQPRNSTGRRNSGSGRRHSSSGRRNSSSGRRNSTSGRRNSKGRRASGEVSEVEQQQNAAMASHLEHVQQQQRRMSFERGRRSDVVIAGYQESNPNSAHHSPRGAHHAHALPDDSFEWGGADARAASVERRASGASPSTMHHGSMGDGSMLSMAAASSMDTNLATIGSVVDDMGHRRVSKIYRMPEDAHDADPITDVDCKPPDMQHPPGSPSHPWGLSGATSPLASGLLSPTSPSRMEASAKQPKRSTGIFTHAGVWVRPSAIGEVLSPVHTEDKFAPIEEHAGFIDASAGIDVAHAILAFEFIDRINDEVLMHYLPQIDNEMGKELGLRHERGRLRTPDASNVDASDNSAQSSPVVDGSETDGGEGSQSTAYYDNGERVSGSGYDAGSRGGSAVGNSAGDADSRRSIGDSRRESWASGSRVALEEDFAEGSEYAADAWDAEGSAAGRAQGEFSQEPSEAPLEGDYLDEDDTCQDRISDFNDDDAFEENEQDSSSRVDDGADLSERQSRQSAGHSLGSSSVASQEMTENSREPGSYLEEEDIRSNSRRSGTPDLQHSGVLHSGGPSSVSHGINSGFWGGSNSAEAQVWPHACSILPKSSSQNRSNKLKAVDSIPDPVPPNMFDISTSSAGGGVSGDLNSIQQKSRTSLVPHPNSRGSALSAVSALNARRSTILAGLPLNVLLPNLDGTAGSSALALRDLSLPSDPGVAAAPASAVYGPGACRVRRPGERNRVERVHAKLQKRSEKRARDSFRSAQRSSRVMVTGVAGASDSQVMSAAKRDPNLGDSGSHALAASAPAASAPAAALGTASVPSVAPSSARDATGIVGHRSTAAQLAASAVDVRGGPAEGMPGSGIAVAAGVSSPGGTTGQTVNSSSTGRHMPGIGHANAPGCLPVAEEEQPWPPRRPSPTYDQFEDLLTMHLRGDGNVPVSQSSPSERRHRRANSQCPFSHEHMDSSAVDLRCGHRFALARLGVARRAARLCCSAGFALEDALICPLCGDQDVTSKPGVSKMLKTYSTNTDAYLGDLRKDWRRPLHLPMQNAANTAPPGSIEAGQSPGCGQGLEAASPARGSPIAMAGSAPMPVKKPPASAPGSARPLGRMRASQLSSLRRNGPSTLTP